MALIAGRTTRPAVRKALISLDGGVAHQEEIGRAAARRNGRRAGRRGVALAGQPKDIIGVEGAPNAERIAPTESMPPTVRPDSRGHDLDEGGGELGGIPDLPRACGTSSRTPARPKRGEGTASSSMKLGGDARQSRQVIWTRCQGPLPDHSDRTSRGPTRTASRCDRARP